MKTDTFQAHPRDSRRPSSIILALLLSLAMAFLYGTGLPASASESGSITWQNGDQGSENQSSEDCTGFHFVLTPAGDTTLEGGELTATFADGTSDQVSGQSESGSGALHFQVEAANPTYVTTATADFTYTGTQSGGSAFQLVLSDATCGETQGGGGDTDEDADDGADDEGDDGADDEGDDGADDEGDDGADDEGDDEGEVGAAQISIDIDCETVAIESDKGISFIELTFDDGSTEKYESDEDGESAGSLEDILDSTITNEDGEIVGGSFATPDGLVSVTVKSGTSTKTGEAPEDCDLGDDDGGDDDTTGGDDDTTGGDDDTTGGDDDTTGGDDDTTGGDDDTTGGDDDTTGGDAGDDGDDTEVGGIVEERCLGSLEIVVIGPDGNVIDGPVLLDGGSDYIETTFLDDSIECDTYTVTLDEDALAEGVSLARVSNTDDAGAEGAVQIVTIEDGDEDRVVFELVEVQGVTVERPPAPAPDAPEQPQPAPDQQPAPDVEAGELARTGAYTQWLLMMALAALLGGTAFLRAADRREEARA